MFTSTLSGICPSTSWSGPGSVGDAASAAGGRVRSVLAASCHAGPRESRTRCGGDDCEPVGLPILVYQAISERYPYASDRHHTFMLEGARDLTEPVSRAGHPLRLPPGETPSPRASFARTRPIELPWWLPRKCPSIHSEHGQIGWHQPRRHPLSASIRRAWFPCNSSARRTHEPFSSARRRNRIYEERLHRAWEDAGARTRGGRARFAIRAVWIFRRATSRNLLASVKSITPSGPSPTPAAAPRPVTPAGTISKNSGLDGVRQTPEQSTRRRNQSAFAVSALRDGIAAADRAGGRRVGDRRARRSTWTNC